MFHVLWRHFEDAYVEGARLIKVRSCRSEQHADYLALVEKDFWNDEFYFNREGKLIRSVDHPNEEEQVYAYSQDGLLIRVLSYKTDSHRLEGQVDFKYDAKRRLIEEAYHHYNQHQDSFSVNLKKHYYSGSIHEQYEILSFNEIFIYRYYHNEHNQVVLSCSFTLDTKTLEEKFYSSTEYRYDEAGRLVERIFKDRMDGITGYTKNIVYDHEYMQRYEHSENNKVILVENTYVFNERGHLLRQKSYENGLFRSLEEKWIEYYE